MNNFDTYYTYYLNDIVLPNRVNKKLRDRMTVVNKVSSDRLDTCDDSENTNNARKVTRLLHANIKIASKEITTILNTELFDILQLKRYEESQKRKELPSRQSKKSPNKNLQHR